MSPSLTAGIDPKAVDYADYDESLTQCYSIGPFNVVSHQHLTVHTIHSSLLYLGSSAPVWPVHEPGEKKVNNWSVSYWLSCRSYILISKM